MCGIAGYVRRAGTAPPAAIRAMADRLAHRGPDGEGFWAAPRGGWDVSLAHRRLAILDLAGGAQPMADPAGSLHLTYNGEVFNFRALRARLEALGHAFRTSGDTEVVLRHMGRHGRGGAASLDGMFAFALWDHLTGTLTLARDRAGIKPLYYAALPCGGVAFASELTALLACPGIGRQIDPAALASFLFRDYVPPPGTLLAGVRKLEPGHTLVWSAGALGAPAPFWRLDPTPPGRPEPVDAAAARLTGALHAAVTSQLVADVPVGVFLSGGVDSSLVAALARAHSAGPLLTFSIGFDDPDFDESAYAQRVAEHLGTIHVTRRVGEADLLASLDAALACLDEPVGDPSIVPTYLVSQLAAAHVKVALGGDGGDELFGGYPTYKAHRLAPLYRAIPGPVRRGVVGPLVGCLPVRRGYQPLEWKLKRFVHRWDDDPVRRHQRWMSAADLPDVRAAMTGDHDPLIGPPPQIDGYEIGRDPLNRVLAFDFATYLPGSVLAKVDRASMAHGLEVRPPFLDNALVELAFAMPSTWKVRGRTTKWLLKRVAAGLLPDGIAGRPKRGFAIPLARWLAGPLRPRLDAILNGGRLWDVLPLCRQTYRRWAEQHATRRADRSKPLWSLLVLDSWVGRVFGR